MRKTVTRTAVLLAALLCLCCPLVACKSSVALTYRDGAYRSKDGEVAYVEAPAIYFALSALTDSPAAHISRTGLDDIPLYAISGATTEQYLASSDLMLYRAEEIELPTLASFGATKLVLYEYSENRTTHQLMDTLDDRDKVSALITLAYATEGISADSIEREQERLVHRIDVLFLSPDESAFGIMLEYRILSSDVNGKGTQFLYDRTTRTYYPVGGLLESYFPDEEESGESAAAAFAKEAHHA